MRPSKQPGASASFPLFFLFLVALQVSCADGDDPESVGELRLRLGQFRLPDSDEFEAIPQDPNNPLTSVKVELGRLLFHDPSLLMIPQASGGRASGSCATCHHADAGFQAGTQQGIGEGGIGLGSERIVRDDYLSDHIDVQPIRTPSAMNAAWFEVVLWNGQFGATGMNAGTEFAWTEDTPKEFNELGFHGLEIQAIAGQQVHRLSVDAAALNSVPHYVELFDAAFPDVAPESRINQVNAGLAIAAYERTLLANEAPFQRWLRGNNSVMTERQLEGARLFFGRAQCADCHNTPGLGGMSFFALGMPDLPTRFPRVPENAVENRGRGGFTGEASDEFAFKTPQLYNLRDSLFLGHGGTFLSVREVIEYKNRAISGNPNVPTEHLASGFAPLGLSPEEIDALTDFVENALYDPNLARYQPSQDEFPNGACPVNDDPLSRAELSCAGEIPAPPVALGGLQIVGEHEGERFEFPGGTPLAPRGVVVIAQNATRAAFESHWGALPAGTLFFTASELNISGNLSLKDRRGDDVDGPCPSATSASMHRLPDGRWEGAEASPGRVTRAFDRQGLIVTEISGTSAPFVFVELSYFP